jgi:hypothetical protein
MDGASPGVREHIVANGAVAQESMSSFGLRLCGLRTVKVKVFFCPSKETLIRVKIFLTTITGGTMMILHFSPHLCARGIRDTRNRLVLRAGAMKAISGMVLAGDLACLRTGCGGSRGVAQERTAPHPALPSWFSHFKPSPATYGGGRAEARNKRKFIYDVLAGLNASANGALTPLMHAAESLDRRFRSCPLGFKIRR